MQQRDENTQVSEEILPPDASRSGQNATYVPCDIRNARQNYGVCLHIIKAFEEDRLSESCTDCARAINRNECASMKMRKEELKAGRALYFKQRVVPVKVVSDNSENMAESKVKVDKTSPSYIRGWNAAGQKAKTPPSSSVKRSRPAPVKTVPGTASKPKAKEKQSEMADLINQMVAEESVKAPVGPEKTVSAAESRRMKAREMARRMRGGK